MERLHKVLAQCGVASRRKAETLIAEGRVQVNGDTIVQLGVKVDPKTDDIKLDGRPVRPEPKVSFLLHKPPGVVTSTADERGRRTVLDLLPGVRQRIYPVGRLDRDSEGLLVLTNDGDLAYYLTHPSNEVPKVYRATVRGSIEQETLDAVVRDGIQVGPVYIRPVACSVVRTSGPDTMVEITVQEGINREVRRLFAALGHKVKRLVRIRIGPLILKGLAAGEARPLQGRECKQLARGMRQAQERNRGEAAEPDRPGRRRPKRSRTYVPDRDRLGKPDPAAGKSRQKRSKPKRPQGTQAQPQRSKRKRSDRKPTTDRKPQTKQPPKRGRRKPHPLD